MSRNGNILSNYTEIYSNKYYKVLTKQDFISYLLDRNESKTIIHGDFETFTINKQAKKPSDLKSYSYSLCLSVYDYNEKKVILSNFVNFFDFLDRLDDNKCDFEIHFTNGNKFDNHFIYSEYLLKNKTIYSLFNKRASDDYNNHAIKKSKLTVSDKKNGVLLTTRVRSSSSLELEGYYKNVKFITVDEYLKTGLSIRTVGLKLLKLGVIDETVLKSTLEYTKYDLDTDFSSYKQVIDYSHYIFNQLDKDELRYIYNDVVIQNLGQVYYNQLYPGFDYDKRTLTSNIVTSFEKGSWETCYQLERKDLFNKKNMDYKFSKYNDGEKNLYERFRLFLKGGLNIYNDDYVGKIVTDCFSADENSAYPYVMYTDKIPTYLVNCDKDNVSFFNQNNDYFSFYVVDYNFINNCLKYIDSKIIKQAIVKYYNANIDNYCYVNDNLFSLINLFSSKPIKKIKYHYKYTFKCEYFYGRDEIASNYQIKTQGKSKIKLDCRNPLDIKVLKGENKDLFSDEEIYNAKVRNNGLFGSPALRLHFDIFYESDDGTFNNIKDGFTNQERNVIFSAYITSKGFYNLLRPLSYIPAKKIDTGFVYADTDSLYLKKEVRKYLPSEMFHKMNLGKWDIENDNIKKMYVLNHKKYCLLLENDEIIIHAGGIRKETFDTTMDFKMFIKTQFSDGCIIKNTGSIISGVKSISIYDRETKLKKGGDYPINHTQDLIEKRKEILHMLKEEGTFFENDDNTIYVESEVGTFSRSDLIEYDFDSMQSVKYLIRKEKELIR